MGRIAIVSAVRIVAGEGDDLAKIPPPRRANATAAGACCPRSAPTMLTPRCACAAPTRSRRAVCPGAEPRTRPTGLIAGAGRAGGGSGEQVVGPPRARPAGPAPGRAAAGAEPDHGVEPGRDVRPAERLRDVGSFRLAAIALVVVGSARRVAAAGGERRGRARRSARSPAARSAT